MNWVFNSSNGVLSRSGGQVGVGFSGHGEGINNPSLQNVPNVGPIPHGSYEISPFFADPEKGPVVARLTPQAGTNDFGRSGFMIHGDTAADVINGTKLASEGCIILARPIREQIAASGDTDLLVI